MAKKNDVERAIEQFQTQIDEAQRCIDALKAIQSAKPKRARKATKAVSDVFEKAAK